MQMKLHDSSCLGQSLVQNAFLERFAVWAQSILGLVWALLQTIVCEIHRVDVWLLLGRIDGKLDLLCGSV